MSETQQMSIGAEAGGEFEVSPVLVAFDGSDGGRDALELARVLCLAEKAPYMVGSCPKHGTRAPGRMLVEFAERESVGTIVVGSPHRGKVGRALLGSVAEHVLAHAPCEVVVAPRAYAATRHSRLAKIGVAFDGSPEGQEALARAEEIARRSGASIEVIVAEDVFVSGLKNGISAGSLHRAPEVLKEAIGSVDPAIEVGGKVVDPGRRQGIGEIASAIAGGCGEDVDLLVLGSRSGPDRFVYGSVSKGLIGSAPCPVLVVPRPH